MNPAFAPKRIKAMNEVAKQVANEWAAELVLRPIHHLLQGGEHTEVSFDVGKEMIDITISVICQAALDYRTSREERQRLLEEIPLAWTEFTMKDAINPFRRFLTWMLPERRRAFIAARRLKEFAFRVIENYQKNPARAPQTVVDMIMKNPNYKSDDERAADIIMILFAGHDTTGFTLALALLELAKHSQEQSRLRKALCGEVGKQEKASAQQPDSSLYLRAVISETMRMYPVVSIPGIKTIGRDFVTKHGSYFIPKGSIIFIAQIAIARDPAIFENPFDYNPSRWLNATEEAKLSLFPFALGNRNCVGQPLANAELYTILPYLIKNFEFSVENEGTLLVPTLLRLENCRLRARKIS
jgi:cytochrome P450